MSATDALPVDPSNVEQLRAWDGNEGAYWAAHADRFDRAVAQHHEPFLDAAAITDGDRVLDVGCGTGQTTRQAARTAGYAFGVDLSAAMLAVARERALAEGLHNVSFEQTDAQIHPFEPASFDVAISGHGVIFFGDLVAGLGNIGQALRPDGRLVLLTWQSPARNEWFLEFTGALAAGREMPQPPPDAPSPFSLADPTRIRQVLDESGYGRVEIDANTAPMWFGNNGADAYQFVLGLQGWMLDGTDPATRARAEENLRSTTLRHETAGGVLYESATWIVTAVRR